MLENIDEIIKDLLKVEKIRKRIEETNLSRNQLIDALPILIDMSEEVDDETTDTLTSFYVSEYGSVKRVAILSKRGKRLAYNKNVVTQEINYVDFEDLRDFHKEDSRKAVVNEFSNYLNEKETGKYGFYMYGQMGIGKTYMLKTFAKKLAEHGKKVGFVNLNSLSLKVKSTFGTDKDQNDFLELLQEVDYLFIDDIGAEKITTWFRDEFLFSLLNERMERRRVTFFSSNYSLNQLEIQESKTSNKQYKDVENAKRLVSRIRSITKEMKIVGENKRY